MSLNLECPCSDQGRELSHVPGAWLLAAEAPCVRDDTELEKL